jgi:hypothetical protein
LVLSHGDDIYPQWSFFVQTINKPQDAKGTKEGYGKVFEVLQAHFAITFQLWQMDINL